MKNKKFCPLPWISSAVRNNGDIRVCCQANAGKSMGIYKKENGEAFNINKDSIAESRNSELAKNIRKSMIEGVTHEACIRCDQEDEAGLRSRRQVEVFKTEESFNLEHAQNATDVDGSIDSSTMPINYIDFRFGNKCNLKCRMCGPTDSDSWYNDSVAVWGNKEYYDSHGVVKLTQDKNKNWKPVNNDYGWVEQDFFWKQLEHNMEDLQLLYIVGGEPLLIDQHYHFLEMAIEKGFSKNITIEYNSNITVIPEKAFEIWKNFKVINIGVSLDATGKVNEYIRYPSKWATIERNLNKLDNAPGEFSLWLTVTVQIYNVLEIPDLIMWKLEQGFKRINGWIKQPLLTAHPLHNPKHLCIKALPKEAKKYVEKKYNDFYPKLEKLLETSDHNEDWKDAIRAEAKRMLDGYIDYMNAEDFSDLLPKFLDYTKRLDELRGESFEEVLPELSRIISGTK